jgi:hypothetical protein
MEELDPRANRYRKFRRERRRGNDRSYTGPERRLGKRREKEVFEILRHLEMQTRGEY